MISRNNTAAIIFTGWVAAYAAPFLIIICYFSRYRFPIEPIIAVLAAIPVHSLLVSVQDAFRRRIDLIKPKN